MKIQLTCDWCGKIISRYPSQVKEHNFCCRACLGHFSNKNDNPEGYRYRDFSKNSIRMTAMNRELNPVRMTPANRTRLRNAQLSDSSHSYEKWYGRHKHRVVAELKIGRPLREGEVVHHLDGDKRNNAPENLLVFASQAEHVKWHKEHSKGGDAR